MNIWEKSLHSIFFNLEKRNYTSKVIHKLVYTEGEEFTNTADILKYQTIFIKIYIHNVIIKIILQYNQF